MSKIAKKTVLPEINSRGETIGENIYGYNFYIKDYQRGYRWESKQIEDLLSDILEFDDDGKKLKYCLQPLVVKPLKEISSSRNLTGILGVDDILQTEINNNKSIYWELIDGQQRLTTIWLILHCCNASITPPPSPPYTIVYEFARSIDEYYLSNARKVIENWFSGFGPLEVDIKTDIRQKINRSIQFIWYEVDEYANSVDIFTKINMGKIPLTNAELFKAQLLNPDSIPEKEYQSGDVERAKRQLEKIAFEWDKIEQSLRDDDFWYFISNDHKEAETRIDYLLRLRAKQLKFKKQINDKIRENDALFPFLAINDYLKSKSGKPLFEKQIEIWEDIVKIHDTLKSWAKDKEMYHYIGFLVTPDAKGENYITELISSIDGLKNSEIKEKVIQSVRNIFKNVRIEELDYDKSSDKKNIRNVLLFFNIYTMIQSKTDNKFSFKQYKDKANSWDIEHIHARATDHEVQQLRDLDKMKVLLYGVREQFVVLGFDNAIVEIDNYLDNILTANFSDYDGFFEFYCRQTDLCGDFNENRIGNLTLLDAETNRSYHNALFPIKRKKIIERDMGEVFIPVCTKNVFLKMYSDKAENMMKWTSQDAEDYLNAMKKALVEEAKICQ